MRIALLILSLILLSGCSGGGGGGGGGATAPVDVPSMLIVDGESGSSVELTAQLRAIALERVDGSLTANLVAEGTVITVSDPAGRVAGVEVQRIEDGVYVALHLMLVEGGIAATQNGQPLALTPSSLLHRIEFGRPLSTMGGGARRVMALHSGAGESHPAGRERGGSSLVLAHSAGLQISNGVWTPRWVVRFGEEGLLRVRVEIASIDLANNRAEALAPRLGEALVELDFSLRPELLSGRAVGEQFEILARITGSRSLVVLRLADGEGGVGGFLEGTITVLSLTSESFTMVREGASIEISVEPETVYMTRGPGGEVAITFDDLLVGNEVAVFAERPAEPGAPLIARAVFVLQ